MVEIELNRQKVALIDAEDADLVMPYKWYACKAPGDRFFVTGYVKGCTVSMHRLILDALPGAQVDHINGDGLDNRRQNLRLCSARQNRWNTPSKRKYSKYKGVWKNGRKWTAVFSEKGQKRRCLGSYQTETEAARVYDAVALDARGEFAWLNFPPRGHKQNQERADKGS